jgi:hypothetical protein
VNTTTPPTLSTEQAAALLLHPDAVALLDLTTSLTAVVTSPAEDIWESPTVLVLATHTDAAEAARHSVAERKFLAALTGHLNGQLLMLHEAGEIPTEDDVREVLAEMTVFDAEIIDLAARRAR